VLEAVWSYHRVERAGRNCGEHLARSLLGVLAIRWVRLDDDDVEPGEAKRRRVDAGETELSTRAGGSPSSSRMREVALAASARQATIAL